MQIYKFRRRYALASLLGITAVIIALCWYSRDLAAQNLLKHQALANETIANSIANSLWPEFADYLESADDVDQKPSLAHNGQSTQLLPVTLTLMRHTNIIRVTMYSPEGKTVFSTEPVRVGEDYEHTPLVRTAQSGTAVSEIFYSNNSIANANDLVISYIPILNSENGQVVTVYELHSDVTVLVKNLDTTQNKIVAVTTLSLLTLYLLLFLVVSRAQTVISNQEKIRKSNEDKIRQQAYNDSLTNLPNRNQFVENIAHAINRTQQEKTTGALLFLDLDRFKTINDSLGHDAGDKLLRIVASRLLECTGKSDEAFRISGDEFIVLMQGLNNTNDASTLAKRILVKINKPITLDEHEIIINVSIGITHFGDEHKSIDELVKEADAAMYHAKKNVSNHYEFYSPEMNMVSCEKLKMETELQIALKNKQFVLYYQPKVDAVTRDILGVEALLRWQHPEKGLIPANTFVPLLEETGLINVVGNWVLSEACQQAKTWIDAGFPPLRMSVNISAMQIRDKNIVNTVRHVLETSMLDAKYLELELTESMFIEDTEFATQVMLELKELGVLLSIDDFGLGYSSLSYLKQFPIDFLKIDRSFIKDLAYNDTDESILVAIASLARSLKLGIIAEGVEDEEQFIRLQNKGCSELQGFLFSPPIPAHEFESRYFSTIHLKAG